jgi:hypothetical protein
MHGWQGIYRFRLERPSKRLAIVSRSAVPMRMGINHDTRRLGVAVRSIVVRGAEAQFDIGYDSSWLTDGFHDPELGPKHRWTTGSAPFPRQCQRLFDGPLEIAISVVCTAKYPLATEPALQVVA